jgi:hypothetical protein
MQSSPLSAYTQAADNSFDQGGSRHAEDRLYQVVTIAAILMVLGSLWLF